MELAVRTGPDRFVPGGAYRALTAQLRAHDDLDEIPAVVLSAFDRSTRLLPFVFYDSHMFPAGAAAIAAALYDAGFERTRAVFQLWNPNFDPAHAHLDGRPLQMLLISSMQIHSAAAYAAIHAAATMGPARPLVIVGGPKAVYEPYHFWSVPSADGPVAPDVVVTGESYVLLELLSVVMAHRGRGDSMRTAFERARSAGALDAVAGLVFLAPGATRDEPVVVDTGLQRLVQDLDELPRETTALTLLEAPHRGRGLTTAPLHYTRVHRHAMIVSLLVTQGCKFRCAYCPIPAVNQKSWRFRSPEALVETIRSINQTFGIKYFFGADDNFFNRRETAEALLTAMARAKTDGRPFGERIRFATEATQFDTYRNRDLLPVARTGGVHAIWFGIEDLTATLVNKGQKPAMTTELFRLMHEVKISPMAMLMFHDGQPFYTPGSLYGLLNQVTFLRRAGAISVQCTAHGPAPGTREAEETYHRGGVIKQVGRSLIPESKYDGNHVLVAGDEAVWKRQLKLIGGYAGFYNPWNLIHACERDGSPLRRRRIGYQAAGMLATAWTAAHMLPFVTRLMTGRLEFHTEPPVLETVPVQHSPTALPRMPAEPTATRRNVG